MEKVDRLKGFRLKALRLKVFRLKVLIRDNLQPSAFSLNP
jgi:hypothetical protein